MFKDIVSTLLPALLLAVMMHLFLAQSTIVYGQSMEPNYHTDERLIIEKITYHFRSPARGDVVVIKDPSGGPVPLIKRVVGLPGERITIANGTVFVNGVSLDESYVKQLTPGPSRTWIVPPLQVFVMGDNRSNSRDSRFFGPVSLSDVLGHAVFRYWPLTDAGALH
jgi:signal peptidase I